MNFIETIKQRAKANKKRIVLPETMDARVLKAASICQKENIAEIILIGEPSKIKELCDKEAITLPEMKIFDPTTDVITEKLINDLYELRKEKGMTIEQARELVTIDYMYYACMLVHEGEADGVVSGACHSTANTLRPALQIIKTAPMLN